MLAKITVDLPTALVDLGAHLHNISVLDVILKDPINLISSVHDIIFYPAVPNAIIWKSFLTTIDGNFFPAASQCQGKKSW